MPRTVDAARNIFLRYIFNNVLLLILPFIVAVVYYSISISVISDGVETLTIRQLNQSVASVDNLFLDLNTMTAQLGNDYDVNFYLGNDGPYSDIEYYNLTKVSRKLSPYVFGNPVLSHIILYIPRSDILIWENGFGAYHAIYGSLLSVEDQNAENWKKSVIGSPGQSQLFTHERISLGGDQISGHLYRQNIGYEGSIRGSVIAVLDDAGLMKLLADIPQEYGGWVIVTDAGGRLITTTYENADGIQPLPEETSESARFEYNGEKMRLYKATSLINGWTYTAVISETQLFSRVRSVRNMAVLLLLFGLVAGIATSYFIAFRNTKPLRHLFELLIPETGKSPERVSSVYDELEQAIIVMKNRNRRLQDEIGSAERVTRTFFFQNALQGNYRSREEFHIQKTLFGILFAEMKYYVIVCRMSAINALRDDTAFPRLRDALLSSANQAISGADFVVPVSFDDVAIVRSTPELIPLHEDAMALVDRIRNSLEPILRGDFRFGVGTQISDPFLLSISYNQASAVISSLSPGAQDMMRFYDTARADNTRYSFPLDVEEHLMRAVRSGNRDLVREVLASLHTENFTKTNLPAAEVENLFVEIKGTALKMLNDFPAEETGPAEFLDEWSLQKPGAEKLIAFDQVCTVIIDFFDIHKKSHNSSLLKSMQEFVAKHYADPELSLTMIADTLRRSENYLSDFYKEQTGERLTDTILEFRLNRARDMLKNGFEPIDRIARECGYANSSSFRRAFKRVIGLSPSEYRLR